MVRKLFFVMALFACLPALEGCGTTAMTQSGSTHHGPGSGAGK
jgi:hypothetical protein